MTPDPSLLEDWMENERCDCVYLHFIHLYILLILGKLEVRVIRCWSELVARQHKKDQSRHFHQKLRKRKKQKAVKEVTEIEKYAPIYCSGRWPT